MKYLLQQNKVCEKSDGQFYSQSLNKHCGRIHLSSKSTSMTNQLDEASNTNCDEVHDVIDGSTTYRGDFLAPPSEVQLNQ